MDSPSIDSSHAFSFLIRRTRQITWIHDQKTSWNKQGLVSMSQCFTSPNYQGDIISNRYLFWWCETNPQKGSKRDIYQHLTNPRHSLNVGLICGPGIQLGTLSKLGIEFVRPGHPRDSKFRDLTQRSHDFQNEAPVVVSPRKDVI